MNPPADAIALQALRRLRTWLTRAVADGSDRTARWNVMMGALEAAMTTWKGLGLSHALSMPFDDLGLHHGTVVGVLLPHTVEYLTAVVPADRLAAVAGALDTTVGSLAGELATFTREIGLPAGLAEMGRGSRRGWLGSLSWRRRARSTCPRPATPPPPTTSGSPGPLFVPSLSEPRSSDSRTDIDAVDFCS